MSTLSVVSITDRELDVHLEQATREVQSFSFRAPQAPEPEPERSADLAGRRIAYRPLQRVESVRPPASEFSLSGRIGEISARDELYTDVEHHVLRVVRRGIQVFFQIYSDYEEASGLARLKATNSDGRLPRDQEPELREKIETACAAGLFALHHYLLARLTGYGDDDAAGADFELAAPPPLPLEGRKDGLHAALHHLYSQVDAHARDDASLVRVVREAAREQAERLRSQRDSLAHLEFFTRYHYRIEPEGVLLAGFELPEQRVSQPIQVPEKHPEDIVGNHRAKLESVRLAQRLACYDLERQQNPFVDLGGFTFTFIGDGSPGTGKTTLIQMIVTLLREHTEVAGLPLHYRNFSVDEISEYQGKSGQNAKQFCQSILDPRAVAFGSVDDVDQVCGSRNDRNASAGALEVTGVFMQELGGAGTLVRGNASFGFFSNHPEKVDDALRQRTQARFLVDGPKSLEDFTDLLHLFLASSLELPPGAGYEPFATQRVREVIGRRYEEDAAPVAPELRRILHDLVSRAGAGRLSSWRDFGEYLHAIQQHDERFTGRSVRNVADAVRARMMDFDLPSEWLEKREVFFGQPYERRVEMIGELRGEVTPEMVIQEINRYADSEARYGTAADRRELDERTRQIVLDARARKAAEHEL